jgi:thiol-disulfide isomerase/thioredoxin
MPRARLSLALPLVWLVGCRMSAGEGSADTPEASVAKAPVDHVVAVHPPAGEVPSIVRTEAQRASAAGRQLVVYVGATWCEPCQRFHRAMEHGDLDSALPRLTLLEFDSDQDGERLRQAGYSSRFIPLFALPKADGTASDKRVEGGIKGDGAVSFVTNKLKDLLAQK